MDVHLMYTWFEQIYMECRYAGEKQEELGFNQSLMMYDALRAHTTDDMKVLLATNNTGFVLVPANR